MSKTSKSDKDAGRRRRQQQRRSTGAPKNVHRQSTQLLLSLFWVWGINGFGEPDWPPLEWLDMVVECRVWLEFKITEWLCALPNQEKQNHCLVAIVLPKWIAAGCHEKKITKEKDKGEKAGQDARLSKGRLYYSDAPSALAPQFVVWSLGELSVSAPLLLTLHRLDSAKVDQVLLGMTPY